MEPIRFIAIVVVSCCVFNSTTLGQTTAKRLTKKITDANAAANQVNEPTPPPAPAPAPAIAPAPRILTNSIPEKNPEQKAAILQKTIEFQKKRAEEGAPTAQYDLGMRYLNGDGLEKNAELAQKWLHSAATNGNTQAAKKLEELNKKQPPSESSQ